MQKSFLKSYAFAVLAALAVALAPNALAQLVSSGLTGSVRGNDGNPVAGATVTAVYTPTNATFTALTSAAGRYNFRGLPVGGPYSITATATGFSEGKVEEITSVLGSEVEVNLVLKSDVLQLEKLVVGGDKSDLDASATGAGLTLTSERLEAKPTADRTLADMISASPLVTLREVFGDREEPIISAVGQNNRYNSIQIDGSRINDLFGLNAHGLAAFNNPLSLDTIEQMSVQISPYDVRQAGFTGASINVVTKSGTNKFRGSVYYNFQGDELFGIELRGPNGRDLVNNNRKVTPRLERTTWGATFGGPIIKDKLFFFLSYEEVEAVSTGRDPSFSTSQEAQVLQKLASIAQAAGDTIDWGDPVTGSTTNLFTDEKITAKVDWQINTDHRLTMRYSSTEGNLPQFGSFANSGSNLNSIGAGGVIAAPDGHFYSQSRKGETIAAQLNSQWTPNFKTEIKYSQTSDDQLTPLNTVAPMIQINGLTGTNLINNTAITNGSYIAGTEQFRHGNVILVDSKQMSATGDYFWRNFVFSGGIEREQTDYYNLFRNGSYGLVAFRNLNDFLNDTNAVITRNVYDPNVRNVADVSDMATTGVFGQARWDVNDRLNVLFGLRYEFVDSAIPPLNQAFVAATGFRNDGSLNGSTSLSPRIGFNLALDDERKTQVRGGIGHFFGRAPWVIFSNSWNAPGVGSGTLFSSQGQLPTSLTAYLRDNFDPASPIGTYTDNPTIRREVDWVEDGTELPQSWRGNIAVEHKLSFLDTVVTAEVVHSIVDKALFLTNENIRPTTVGADGRQRFAGSTSTAANTKFPGYTNMIRVQNTSLGESTYATVQWSRPMKNKWGFDLSYTRGRSTEAQPVGQTTAGGQWFRNAVFNQNTPEEATADYQTKDRIQLSLSRQFEFFKDYRTTVSLYYEGRSGNPYSWVFGSDLNGDGTSFNDLPAIPTDVNDARFDFSAMPTAERDAFFAFLQSSGLSAYAGGIAPKNGFREPWVNRLDLNFLQNIPIRGSAKLQLRLDFINFGAFLSRDTFGYFELAPFGSNAVFRTRTLTSATSYNNTTGRIQPRFASQPTGFNIDNNMSRWRIQVSAKLLF